MNKVLHSKVIHMFCYVFLISFFIFSDNSHAEKNDGPDGVYQVADVSWEQTDDEFWVAILGESPPTYTVYELLDPLRVVVDIANANLDFPVNMNLTSEGLPVTMIKGSQLKDRTPPLTRIELQLAEDRSYTVNRDGNDIVVVFKEKSQPAVAAKQKIKPATVPTVSVPPVPVAQPMSTLQGKATVIFDVKVDKTSGETRVYLRADGPITNFKKAELPPASGKPSRMYIDIPEIRMPRLTRKKNISKDLSGIRIARRGTGVRIVFDSARAQLFPYSIMTSPEGLLINIGKESLTMAEMPPPATTPEVQPIEPITITEPVISKQVEPEPTPEPAVAEPLPKPVTRVKKIEPPAIAELIQPVIPSTTSLPPVPKTIPADVETQKQKKAPTNKSRKVEKKAPAITDEFGFAGYETPRITVDFFKVDLHNVFRLFGEISGRNIVVDEGVNGSLTLALKDVPWDFALDIILNLKDLQKEEQFHTLVISPKSKQFSWPERASKKIAFKTDETVTAKDERLSIKERNDTPIEIIEAQKLMRQGQSKERANKYREALDSYEKAIKKWPQNIDLAKRIASLALVHLNMNAKGAYYAERVVKENPTDYDAALLAAIGFANMKKPQMAKHYFDLAISAPRPNGESLVNYATFCEEYKSYAAALKLYNKHEQLYGYTLPVMIGKARVLDKKGNTSEALDEYKSILNSGFELPPDLKKYISGRLAMSK